MITYRDLAMLSPRAAPFNRAGWIFELKYDSFRVLASKRGDDVHLVSRRGNNLIACYPEIDAALRGLPDFVLDGELVVIDAQGKSQFKPLRRRLALKRRISIDHAAKTTPAAIFAFDILELRGKDMRQLPLLKRKTLLKHALTGSPRIRYLDHIGENGERLFVAAEKLGVEGIVAKPADSQYRRGRASGWLKVKTSAGRAIDEERAKWNEQ
jgi:ATP-dependent DNA ligase